MPVYNFAMTSEAKILIEKAKNLPASDREDILEAILVSLHREPSADADQAWRDLIDERLAALDNGAVETFGFDEAIAKLRST
jgi:putative addiction module component (TIGR02574 family)